MLLHLGGVLEHLRPIWELPPATRPIPAPESRPIRCVGARSGRIARLMI